MPVPTLADLASLPRYNGPARQRGHDYPADIATNPNQRSTTVFDTYPPVRRFSDTLVQIQVAVIEDVIDRRNSGEEVVVNHLDGFGGWVPDDLEVITHYYNWKALVAELVDFTHGLPRLRLEPTIEEAVAAHRVVPAVHPTEEAAA